MPNDVYINTNNDLAADLSELPLPDNEMYVLRAGCIAEAIEADEAGNKDSFIACLDFGLLEMVALKTTKIVVLGDKVLIANPDNEVLGGMDFEEGYVVTQLTNPKIFTKENGSWREVEQSPFVVWENLREPEVAERYGLNV